MPKLEYPHTIQAASPARASEVQGNFNAIKDLLDGNLESVNLADLAVSEGKLADSAVSTSKLASGAVTDEKVAANADIARSKIASTTASRALVSDSNGKVSASSVTAPELGRLSGVTSPIQTQLSDLDSGLTVVEGRHPQGGTYYFGQVNSDGSGAPLPPGWTSFSSSGVTYGVTHNLGHSNYVVFITPRSTNILSTNGEPTAASRHGTWFGVSMKGKANSFFFLLIDYS